jgi:hypothetical protein
MTRCHRARWLISRPTVSGPSVRPTVSGSAHHPEGPPGPPQPLVHSERELDVLTREGRRKAAQLDDQVAAPDRERADAAEHEVAARPADAVVQECPEIVEQLEVRQRLIVDLQRPGVPRVDLLGPPLIVTLLVTPTMVAGSRIANRMLLRSASQK